MSDMLVDFGTQQPETRQMALELRLDQRHTQRLLRRRAQQILQPILQGRRLRLQYRIELLDSKKYSARDLVS